MNKKYLLIALALVVAVGAGYAISQAGKSGDSNTQSTPTASPASSGSTLDMSNKQLTAVPADVLSQTDVTVLNLSNNQLTTLPPEISKLTKLQTLNIENNRIEALPSELSQLTNLRQILANNNRMTTVPAVLGGMTWLEKLDLSGNSIPNEEIMQLKAKLAHTDIKY